MNKKLYPRLFFSLMALLVVSGCTARIDHRGKLPDPEQIAKIKPGVQDKEEVLRLIGSPSTIAVFDENTWVYNYKVTESVSFFTPQETAQKLYLIRFDAQGKVREVREEDGHGHDIVPVRRVTPNPGDDRTFLQSIFGNFGKKSKKIIDEEKQKDD
ncbi:outer membrane protein assembly factor BamE [Caedimonas varicaedens]|jgi:outer membrane protein assembly factor BamE (lipoprotein component of BamABCDE complex)|uniref:Outer membrane protein assembly factor BamE n=1 Tax=Caedimonas varicaedens TaxID=1629334 RepID=A0A0K8MDA9_9PROT|nr:outer membrane protein assembly factor BamE [Caedimonas varicaedens]